MTVRVYLVAARITPGPDEPGDLPAERLFVHAAEFPELWVETESLSVPAPGKRVAFCLAGETTFGVDRVLGTVERIVDKGTRSRVRAGELGGPPMSRLADNLGTVEWTDRG